jgi:hypothetical protein
MRRKTPSLGSLRLQLFDHSAFPELKALFFTSLWKKRPGTVALTPGSHTLGFGYPLDAQFSF